MNRHKLDEKAIAAALWFAIFIAGFAFLWQLTEPDDATNELHQMKVAIWHRITS